MKFCLLLLLTLCCSICFTQSLAKIKVQETRETFADNNQSSFMVDVYVHEQDYVEKELKEALKDFNAKIDMKKEIFADNAKVSFLGSNTVDIYAKIVTKSEGVFTITIGVDLGGVFLSSKDHEKESDAFEKWLYDLAVKMSKNDVLRDLKAAEKVLSKQEKELEGLKSDKSDLEKDIVNYNQKIDQAKQDIDQNLKNQADTEKKIAEQKDVLKQLEAKEKAVN